MRAVTVPSVPASPVVTELENPRPEAGELLVKVASSSLNGFDARTVAGRLQQMMEHRFPLVLGKDFAGTVAAVGEGVDDFRAGDAVFGVVMKPYLGAGSLAEYVTVSAGHGVARMPESLPVVDAGALGLAGTAALDSIAAADVRDGETVLVSGATGGVGSIAAQYAAARGAKVIATARSGEASHFVRNLTKAEVQLVDYTADLAGQVRELAPGGVAAALHLAGDGAELARLLAPGGRIASTLGFGPEAVREVTAGQEVTAVSVVADPTTATLGQLAADVVAGLITVQITATYSLEQVPKAFADFGSGALGKLAVAVA